MGISLNIPQSIKSLARSSYLNETCSSAFRSYLTGNKLENIGYTRQIAVTNVKNSSRVNFDYKVGDKILIRKDGILHKQSPSGEKIHGP
jgi:hypothetical protein